VQEFENKLPNTNIIILSHENEWKYVKELLIHLESSLPEDVNIFSMKDIAPSDESINKLWNELQSAHMVLAVISSHFLADDILHRLRQDAIELHNKDMLEAVQILARSVYNPQVASKREIKLLPKVPLSTHQDRDAAYTQIVDFVLDKIDLIKIKYELLRKQLKIQTLEKMLRDKGLID